MDLHMALVRQWPGLPCCLGSHAAFTPRPAFPAPCYLLQEEEYVSDQKLKEKAAL